MADKRRPHLRDEVSASLEGLDDLAAELTETSAPAEPTPPAAPEETPPAPASTPVPAAETRVEPRTRHLDIGSTTTVTPVDETVEAEEAAPPAAEPVDIEPPVSEMELEEVPHATAAIDPDASESLVFEAVTHNADARASGANAGTEAAGGVAADRAIVHKTPPVAEDDLETPAQDEDASAVQPAAAEAPAAVAARPWTPAAAMEPIPPLAPPPSRPLPASADVAQPRLPADGGKKMNILPVVVIAVFILVVVTLIVIVVRQT